MKNKQQYFLYIDDSGKLDNANDKFLIFGGVLFKSEGKCINFAKKFKEARDIITKCDRKEIKGNKLFKKYVNSFQKPYLKADIENLISQYKLVDATFGIVINKQELFKNNPKEKYLRNYCLGLLLKTLLKLNLIESFSSIFLYLDNEKRVTKYKDEFELHNFLNGENSKNRAINFLRWNKIFIEKVEFLNSKEYLQIQAADIIANFLNKVHNGNKNKKEILELFKRYKIEVITLKFPNIEVYDATEEIRA